MREHIKAVLVLCFLSCAAAVIAILLAQWLSVGPGFK
jgi:hypothetical protein